MNDPANDSAIVNPRNAAHIGRRMRLDPSPAPRSAKIKSCVVAVVARSGENGRRCLPRRSLDVERHGLGLTPNPHGFHEVPLFTVELTGPQLTTIASPNHRAMRSDGPNGRKQFCPSQAEFRQREQNRCRLTPTLRKFLSTAYAAEHGRVKSDKRPPYSAAIWP